jgi:hypothetical protein
MVNLNLTHVAEEVADVILYSIRLCDILDIDLSRAILSHIHGNARPQEPSEYSVREWESLEVDCISSRLGTRARTEVELSEVRTVLLLLTESMGAVGHVLAKYSEAVILTDTDKELLSKSISSIVMAAADVASAGGLSTGMSLSSKIDKNAKKYPVNLAKGSSAKYTNYAMTESYQKTSIFSCSFLTYSALSTAAIFVAGLILSKRNK